MNNGVPIEAPTFRLNPGDQLVLNFTNNITVTGPSPKSRHAPMAPIEMGDMRGAAAQNNPCLGGMVTETTTNIHFHGLNVARFAITMKWSRRSFRITVSPFSIRFQIPANDPPGLYWYHPHPHGFSATQVYGGASGGLIIGGSNSLPLGCRSGW
jgi:FtsP/CotA-like multicopper oxidase with cupredoxin domain